MRFGYKRYAILIIFIMHGVQSFATPAVIFTQQFSHLLNSMLLAAAGMVVGHSYKEVVAPYSMLEVQQQQQQTVQTTRIDWELVSSIFPETKQLQHLVEQQYASIGKMPTSSIAVQEHTEMPAIATVHNEQPIVYEQSAIESGNVIPCMLPAYSHNYMPAYIESIRPQTIFPVNITVRPIRQQRVAVDPAYQQLYQNFLYQQQQRFSAMQQQYDAIHKPAYITAVQTCISKILYVYTRTNEVELLYALLDMVQAFKQLQEQQKHYASTDVDLANRFLGLIETILSWHTNEHGELRYCTMPYSLDYVLNQLYVLADNQKFQKFCTKSGIQPINAATVKELAQQYNLLTAKKYHASYRKHVKNIVDKVIKNPFNKQLIDLRLHTLRGRFDSSNEVMKAIQQQHQDCYHYTYAQRCYNALKSRAINTFGILYIYEHDPLFTQLTLEQRHEIAKNTALLVKFNQVLAIRHSIKQDIMKEYAIASDYHEINAILYKLVDCRMQKDYEAEFSTLMDIPYSHPQYSFFFLPNGLLKNLSNKQYDVAKKFSLSLDKTSSKYKVIQRYANKLLIGLHNGNVLLVQRGFEYLDHAQKTPAETDIYLNLVHGVCMALHGDQKAQELFGNNNFLAHKNTHEHADEVIIARNMLAVFVDYCISSLGIQPAQLEWRYQEEYLSNGINARYYNNYFVQHFVVNKNHTPLMQQQIVSQANRLLALLEHPNSKQKYVYQALRYLKHANASAEQEAIIFLKLSWALQKAVEGNDKFYEQFLYKKDFLQDFVTPEHYHENKQAYTEAY